MRHVSIVNTLMKEKCVLAEQLEQSHDKRLSIQKEMKRSAKYIGQLEERVLEAN